MNTLSRSLSSFVECRFCHFFNGNSGGNGINTPWLQSDTYAALISVGAFVPGWSLICPKNHSNNMSELYCDKDFWEFAARAENVVCEEFGEVRLFEHGGCANDSLTSCGTGHAHLHVVPLNFSLVSEALSFDTSKAWQSCRAADIRGRTQGREYLFVADTLTGEETEGFLCILEESTSQFFRRVIARRLGNSDQFDYRSHPMIEVAEASAKRLHDMVTMQEQA